MDAQSERFEEEDAQVLGISVDSTETNRAWAESLGVENIALLSDFWPHGQVARTYGVLREQGFTERATFIVDKAGVIRFLEVYEIDQLPTTERLLDSLDAINE